MISLPTELLLCGAFLLIFWLARRPRIPIGLQLPPGPPRKPIIGNAMEMPRYLEWETYTMWAKQYGEICYVEAFGNPMIFINSRRLAYELFDKRSSLYSDRTTLPMIVDLMGFGWSMGVHRYGEWWRRHRRAMHEAFHPAAVQTYKPIQLKHTREMLRRLLKQPDDFTSHFRHAAGATIMEIAYGIHVKPQDDPYIHIAEVTLHAIGEAGVPGRFLVDMLPWMKYIPEWVPGASFKRQARIWRKYVLDMVDVPFQHVKEAMAKGTAVPSFTSSHLEVIAGSENVRPDAEDVIKNTAAVIYAGGSDTTANAIKALILAMVLFPEVQKKAQVELDGVLGWQRQVEFEDEATLPYTVAVYKEVMRWHPLVPMGVAHAVSEDDIIDGYFIPKGTIVFGNTWMLLRDQADFGPNTDEFNPDQFMQPNVRDPAKTGAFGYGRRICPGRYMAENSLFIATASILQLFEILPATDREGNVIQPEYEWTSGLLSFPADFKCTIRPRSKAAEELILSVTNDF